jgi:hypothetical protein
MFSPRQGLLNFSLPREREPEKISCDTAILVRAMTTAPA